MISSNAIAGANNGFLNYLQNGFESNKKATLAAAFGVSVLSLAALDHVYNGNDGVIGNVVGYVSDNIVSIAGAVATVAIVFFFSRTHEQMTIVMSRYDEASRSPNSNPASPSDVAVARSSATVSPAPTVINKGEDSKDEEADPSGISVHRSSSADSLASSVVEKSEDHADGVAAPSDIPSPRSSPKSSPVPTILKREIIENLLSKKISIPAEFVEESKTDRSSHDISPKTLELGDNPDQSFISSKDQLSETLLQIVDDAAHDTTIRPRSESPSKISISSGPYDILVPEDPLSIPPSGFEDSNTLEKDPNLLALEQASNV
ncbi:MAG: hypothetical protein WCG42_07375 [Parachlamydiaceae bacterium]